LAVGLGPVVEPIAFSMESSTGRSAGSDLWAVDQRDTAYRKDREGIQPGHRDRGHSPALIRAWGLRRRRGHTVWLWSLKGC
jgi:hypothetical protein